MWNGQEVRRHTSLNASEVFVLTADDLSIENEGGHVLDLEFIANGTDASVEISQLQMLMPEPYILCQDFKMCLDPLHVHDDESRSLRTSNRLQLECLLAETPTSA